MTYLLQRVYREDGKVKRQTLGNLSHLPPATVRLIQESLRGRISERSGELSKFRWATPCVVHRNGISTGWIPCPAGFGAIGSGRPGA